MTFDEAILEQQAKRLFPFQFAYVPTCRCGDDTEPDMCPDGHMHCAQCSSLYVEVRL